MTGAGCPLEERARRAGAFSGSRWYPYRGVAILGRQRGCGVSWGLAVAQVPFLASDLLPGAVRGVGLLVEVVE